MAQSFHGVIAFALMVWMLLVGALLRRRIRWLQQGLVPASIIGGLLGWGLVSVGAFPGYTPKDFTVLTFHCFTLSFMSLCLTGSSAARPEDTGIVWGGLWLTLIWTVSLGLQAVMGYGVVVAYNEVAGDGLSPLLGAMVTHGFTQGPGQALTYGNLWEQQYGLNDAAQVGLIYASLGFLVAFLVGVPLARWLIRQRQARQPGQANAAEIDASFLTGFYPADESRPVTGYMVSHPANLDSLAWHLGLLGVAYILTHLWLTMMAPVVAGVDLGGIRLSVFFDHNLFFIHGLVVCVLMRALINRMGWRSAVDDRSMQMLTGTAVDIMVVGTLMSIQFSVLKALLVPVTLVTVAITLLTLFGCVWVARRSGRYGDERAVTMFGCCCGSTGSGLLLLRILDPNYASTVARELAFYNIAIVVVNFHVLYLFAPVAPSLSVSTYLLAFGGTSLLALLAIPLLGRSMKQRASCREG
ncbi:MAG: sodium/glutamate symporter [Lautropia sp.]|nr:sodium/glutamate symporter [Lautropia sp.]